jgi:hypothetical protein
MGVVAFMLIDLQPRKKPKVAERTVSATFLIGSFIRRLRSKDRVLPFLNDTIQSLINCLLNSPQESHILALVAGGFTRSASVSLCLPAPLLFAGFVTIVVESFLVSARQSLGVG